MRWLALVAVLALVCAGCGSVNEAVNQGGPGFWNGLWDGWTAPWAFLGDLLGIGEWGVYSVHNSGGWYDFGFLLGVGALGGGLFAVR